MHSITRCLKMFAGCLALLLAHTAAPAADSRVSLMRTPEGGVQPQVAVDSAGTVHLVYLQGEAGSADVYYARQEAGKSAFSKPMRVNSEAGCAIAAGTIRGAQLALGKAGRVHVAWNGSKKSSFTTPRGMPMLYARMNDAGTAFEPERNVMTFTMHLDGGGTVAADQQGNVYVAWHASTPENQMGEAGRTVYLARSCDDGRTFAPEKQAGTTPTGACACCGMRAWADRQGNVFTLYRAATQVLNRDIILMVSHDQGASFETIPLQKWKIGKCPMSSESLYETPTGLMGAWEVDDQVHFAPLDRVTGKLQATPVAVPSKTGKSKHPTLAANARGDLLVAWTEGTGWQKGGSLGWQVYDPKGKPTADQGRSDGVPVWGMVAAYARPDGSFVVIY
jgi:hypothetical protein